MEKAISLEEMFDKIKAEDENAKIVLDSADKTVEIIRKVVAARERAGLSQREVAKRCGIKQPALARIEALKVVPKLNTIIKIAKAVGVEVTAFDENDSLFSQTRLIAMATTVIGLTYNNIQQNLGGFARGTSN